MPRRALPKWKLKPITAPLMASRSTRMLSTNSSALRLASAALKVSTIAPSSPVAASSRSLATSEVRWNDGSSGLKKVRGCGSKVSTAAGRCAAWARSIAMPITARWPRWTPSKLPMATTGRASRSRPEPSSRTTTKGWGEFGSAMGEIGLGRWGYGPSVNDTLTDLAAIPGPRTGPRRKVPPLTGSSTEPCYRSHAWEGASNAGQVPIRPWRQ